MLGTMEEIKAKMDGNVLSLFDFLESDEKSDVADTLESNQLDREPLWIYWKPFSFAAITMDT